MSARTALFAALLGAPALAGASGALDARFDDDGVAVHVLDTGIAAGDGLHAGLIDAQGRLVGAGGHSSNDESRRGGIVMRLLPDGRLDPAFGDQGVARTPPPEASFDLLTWHELIEYPDGRLLAAGSYETGDQDLVEFAYVCRFLSNGAPDASFGGDGCVQPQIWFDSSHDSVAAAALQEDGRIVLVGQTDYDQVGPGEYYVARLDDDGGFDRCFGDASCQAGGVRIEPDAALLQFLPRDVALAPDGRIVVAGRAAGQGTVDMLALRLLPTGEVDASFGDNGHRFVAFDQGGFDFDVANDVEVAPNGRVFLVGSVETPLGGQISGAAALDANGDVIAGYGDGGRRLFFFNDVAADQVALAARLQPDGKLVVAGYAADNATAGDCGVARLDADGDLDPVFAINGTLVIDGNFGGEPPLLDDCRAVALRDGAIALFGSTGTDTFQRDALFAKLDQDGVFRDGFED